MNPIPLKQWIHEKAAREGRRPSALYSRLARGKYPALLLCRLNQRVVFVVEAGPALARGLQKRTLKVPQNEKEKSE